MSQIVNLPHTFSCCIIGSGKLTLDCAQQLLDSNQRILGVVSANRAVRHWADKNDIPNIDSTENQEAFLGRWEFDYLFSIINPDKVSDALLALPRKSAINYHDAPLPRYAGLHVTSWALTNQEKSYGVTWHEMTSQFDAGPIIKQVEFPIDRQETAFSLNVKCFQRGREAFAELIIELAQGTAKRRPQEKSERTVFPRSMRPENAAIIDWSQPGDRIEARLRALSYQPDPNPLAIAKVLISDNFYLVIDAAFKESPVLVVPGTVIKLDRRGIDVATKNGVITLKSLMTINGEWIELDRLIAGLNLLEGDILTSPTASDLCEIQKADQLFWRREKFWLDRLTETEPYLFPQQLVSSGAAGHFSVIADVFSEKSLDQLAREFPNLNKCDLVIALYYCFLARFGGVASFDIGLSYPDSPSSSDYVGKLFNARVPFKASYDYERPIKNILRDIVESLTNLRKMGSYARDIHVRNPAVPRSVLSVSVAVVDGDTTEQLEPEDALVLVLQKNSDCCHWMFNAQLLTDGAVRRTVDAFSVFFVNAAENLDASLKSIALISVQEQQKLLVDWNATQTPYDTRHCVHQLFEAQAKFRPNDIALVYRDAEISYGELNVQADRLAIKLQSLGAQPDMLVGIFIGRSIDMVIGLLGILKSGAAYVPLDPGYPKGRIALMVEDAKLSILLTHSSLLGELPQHSAKIVCIDDVSVPHSESRLVSKVKPHHLAYVIYTSGSTGRPKGVMIEHGNVMNFFTGMDTTLNFKGDPGVWLAVTSISFDISVLEIFWTLGRGFKVVIQEEESRTLAQEAVVNSHRKMDVGLFYFSSDAGPSNQTHRYKLLLEGAKFADKHGFSAVWTPERHFHLFGGLYPNPSVTSAAIAAITSKIAIRAGSIVLPLHNPVRVVEEWSVVDNISAGRVGFSFASGWHANDFSLFPENYENRKQIMYDSIEKVRDLWAGKEVTMKNGEGKPFTARVYPAPVQKEPPIWITTAGNIETFRQAGEGGFNVLTNLLGQSVEEIKDKIIAYREGRKRKGYSGEGNVSLMVHTFVGTDMDQVREIVREPFCKYLKTSFDLVKIAPWAFPAFRQPSKITATDPSFDASTLTDEDLDALLDHAFERYFETAGVFGTPASCLQLIQKLKKAGVDEIACLVDFGVEDELVLESLTHLNALRQLSNPTMTSATHATQPDYSIAAQVQRHGVTHFQCTPSMARILSADPSTLAAMSKLNQLLLGGEALPLDLASTLKPMIAGNFVNVYGPTETTIWSTSSVVPDRTQELSIGRPIANTLIYILDKALQPVPTGAPGELFIGGAGVVRGYLDRPELTAERFLQNPFENNLDARIYRTGDLVRYRDSGDIEYLGRIDHQVKLRGYRIELGEIEAQICADASVRDCVVVVSDADAGTQRLVAYVVLRDSNAEDVSFGGAEALTEHWHSIWDETYGAGNYSRSGQSSAQSKDPTLNIAGWLNSYTGEQHAEKEMQEWVTVTTDRILALKPRRVLEIGCGSGMILYRVAPHCEAYVGVDFSAQALDLIAQRLGPLGLDHVQLIQCAANSVTLTDVEPFDLVVINSVAQYFPCVSYFADVLKNLLPFLAESGRIFVGDVRSFSHMDSFHNSLELARAPASLSLSELQIRIAERREKESELLIDPDFFYALQAEIPQIEHVDIQLKRGSFHNEMSMFRYDVYLSRKAPDSLINETDFRLLPELTSIDEIRDHLSTQSSSLVMRDIVNPRIEGHCHARRLMQVPGEMVTVSDLRTAMTGRGIVGIDPERIYCMESDWDISLTWARSGREECYDAYFIPPNNAGKLRLRDFGVPGRMSAPYFEPARHGSDFFLTERLKESLREKLPDFMVPTEFVLLPALPLTPNGKIDRKALPKPEKRRRAVKEEFVAPVGDIEQIIATVLQEMLNIEKIGSRDNFTDIGANSLLIVQANNRLNQRLSQKVSLVSMYRYPTIASLAEYLRGDVDSKQGMEKGQSRGEKRKAAQAGRAQRLTTARNKTH